MDGGNAPLNSAESHFTSKPPMSVALKALPMSALLVKLPPHCLLSGQIGGPVWRSLNINPFGAMDSAQIIPEMIKLTVTLI